MAIPDLEWSDAVTAIGATGLHFHDLRHTGNTLAAATGASLKELMVRMGHASPKAALRYQHATRDRDAAIAKALSELVDQAQPALPSSEPDTPTPDAKVGNQTTKRRSAAPSAGASRSRRSGRAAVTGQGELTFPA